MQFDNITISFPRLCSGIVRFHLTKAPWDYLDCDRRRAAKVLRWLRGGTDTSIALRIAKRSK